MLDTIINDKCENIFPEIKKKYKDFLIISDPPYNINFKNYDEYEDNLSDEEYIDLFSPFKNIPSAIIQYPEEMMKYIVPSLGVPDEVLAWCYPSNIARRFRLINIYKKKPDFSKVLQPYRNPTDKRVAKLIVEGSKGTPLYDWFSDINIVKNVSKEKTEHPCPVPVALIERIILLLTKEGDIIYDPFMGSGSTAIACLKTKRNYIGTEKSKKYCEVAERRIAKFKEENRDIFKEDI